MFNKVYLLRPFVITCSSAGMHIESGINILYINCLKLYGSVIQFWGTSPATTLQSGKAKDPRNPGQWLTGPF